MEWAAQAVALVAGLVGIFATTHRELPAGRRRPTVWAWFAAVVLVGAGGIAMCQSAEARAESEHVRGQLDDAQHRLNELREGQAEQLIHLLYRTSMPVASYRFEVRTGRDGTNNPVTARIKGHHVGAPRDTTAWSPWAPLDAPGDTFKPNTVDTCVFQTVAIDRIDRIQIRHAPAKDSTWSLASVKVTDEKAKHVYEADLGDGGLRFDSKTASHQIEVKKATTK